MLTQKYRSEYRLIYVEPNKEGNSAALSLVNALQDDWWIIKDTPCGNGVMYLVRRRYTVDHAVDCQCPGCKADRTALDTSLTF